MARKNDKPELLTPAELVELTGYQNQSKQAEWLEARGWTFETGADGKNKVARSHLNTMLNPPPAPMRLLTDTPDFGALFGRS